MGQRLRVGTDELEPRKQLLVLMIDTFNLDELGELCFNLSVGHDELVGETINTKSMALIEHMERRNELYKLVGECQKMRPNDSWPSI